MKRCNEPKQTCDTDFSGIENSLKDLIHAQLLIGKEVAKLAGGVARVAVDGLRNVNLPGMPKMKSCCDIPEPCWMPVSSGEVHCTLRPGDQGEICFVIANLDFRAHQYTVQAVGKDAGLIGMNRTQFQLGPKERICVTATLTVPKEDRQKDQNCCCENIEAIIWVRGCRDHYVRWTVDVADKGKCCCHEIQVNDSADYVLHWYDHFYVSRPCFGPMTHPSQK